MIPKIHERIVPCAMIENSVDRSPSVVTKKWLGISAQILPGTYTPPIDIDDPGVVLRVFKRHFFKRIIIIVGFARYLPDIALRGTKDSRQHEITGTDFRIVLER